MGLAALYLLASACGDSGIAAAPGGVRPPVEMSTDEEADAPGMGSPQDDRDGPPQPNDEPPGNEEPSSNSQDRAECEMVEEPKGPRNLPNQAYAYEEYAEVATIPGQQVTVTKCGQFGNLLGTTFELPVEECQTLEVRAVGYSTRVLCYDLEDSTGVPGVENSGVTELGWKAVYIETGAEPVLATCAPGEYVVDPDSKVVEGYVEVAVLDTEPGEKVTVARCDSFSQDGEERVVLPGCTTRDVVSVGETLELTCLTRLWYEDGTTFERGAEAIYYLRTGDIRPILP
ncbi:MAG: hypothetical protein AAF997_18265 [Myxococcota bacterium]